MKTIIKMATLAGVILAATLYTTQSYAQDNSVKLTVKGVNSDSGVILVALGDFSDPTKMVSAMVPAKKGEVVITLGNTPVGPMALNLFHDMNGNYNLDTTADGTPLEDCYRGTIDLTTGENSAEVTLFRFSPTTEEQQ